MHKKPLLHIALMLIACMVVTPGFAGGTNVFEANCVNLLFPGGNTRVFIQFKPQLLHQDPETGAPLSALSVNLMVKGGKTPNIYVNRYEEYSFNFSEGGYRKDFRKVFDLDLEPGSYRVIVEVEDLLTGAFHYHEIPYDCADKGREYNLSDILFLEDTSAVLRNPAILIQNQVSGASESLNFYTEIYTPSREPLAVRAILFRQEEFLGQLKTRKFDQVDRLNRILQPRTDKTVFSDAFQLEELESGAYLLEIYLYEGEELVAETYRFFNIEWEDLGRVYGNLETSIRQLEYIALEREREEMLSIERESEQQEAFDAWWAARQAGKIKSGQEALEEYYKKVYKANELFGAKGNGWKTDRGKIMIFYGEPDEVQELEYRGASYLVWTFTRWEVKYIFKKDENEYTLMAKNG